MQCSSCRTPKYRGWLAGRIFRQLSESRRLLLRLLDLSKERCVSTYYIAKIHAGLGEMDASIDWLAKAYRGTAGNNDISAT
jgi:hypothetical protein